MPNETYYYATGTEVTSIANAVRTKSGTSAALTFPDGFVTAINGINSAGSVIQDSGNNLHLSSGGAFAQESDVNFIDYDGTILYAYTAAEAQALTALPPNPTHTGLTAQGWNWTLAQIKAQLTAVPGGPVWVGQMYITTSGATEIDIVLDDPDYLTPYLMLSPKGTVTVDWGDGSSTDTMSGNNLSYNQYQSHTYASIGTYTISLTIGENESFAFYNTGTRAGILRTDATNNASAINGHYSRTIRNIRLGTGSYIDAYAFSNCYNLQTITMPSHISISQGGYLFQNCYNLQSVTIPSGTMATGSYVCSYCLKLRNISLPVNMTNIGSSTFSSCYSLTSITIPATVTNIDSYGFSNCYNLQYLVIPSGITTINTNMATSCYNLKTIILPSTITTINNSAFNNCYSLQNINIPSNVTRLSNSLFYYCYQLKNITIPSTVTEIGTYTFFANYLLKNLTIPSSVTTIGSYAFGSCQFMQEYHFQRTTPPTLSTNAFASIVSGTKIYVPYSSDHSILNAYKTADNWSTYATYIEEEPQ